MIRNIKKSSFRLYVIIDAASIGNHPLTPLVNAVLRGGASMLQLRAKNESTRTVLAIAKTIQKISNHFNVPFILNDRADLVLVVGASGVHLGQDDMPLPIARKLLGREKIIGVSAKTIRDAQDAQKEGADYLGVGPVFATYSKLDAGSPIGLKRLSSIAKSASIPVVGIGGINAKNAKDVLQAGADGIAVISAILHAKDPEVATRTLWGIVTTND